MKFRSQDASSRTLWAEKASSLAPYANGMAMLNRLSSSIPVSSRKSLHSSYQDMHMQGMIRNTREWTRLD